MVAVQNNETTVREVTALQDTDIAVGKDKIIYIAVGDYYGDIVLYDRNLILEGSEVARPHIYGRGENAAISIVNVKGGETIVKGLHIRGGNPGIFIYQFKVSKLADG